MFAYSYQVSYNIISFMIYISTCVWENHFSFLSIKDI